MNRLRRLHCVHQLPIFQNRLYESEAEARACPKEDVELVEDPETGLVYNRMFRTELMQYDKHYQNEQAVSPLFQGHQALAALPLGATIVVMNSNHLSARDCANVRQRLQLSRY